MHDSKPTSLFRSVTTAVLLSALLLFPLLSVAADALTPYAYNMSSDYQDSVYYDNLTSLTLTGNNASDLLAVAMSQLGYHEGSSDKDFAGKNASGNKNFVEYNRLYGKLDNNEGNGYSYGYAWCASFVNWCLRQADVALHVSGGEVSCSRWIRDFLKPKDRFRDSLSRGGNYTPVAGDLIFFKRSGSSLLSTHVGIVRYSDGTYVYTIEGNTESGSVALDSYLLDSTYIIGYGVLPYETKGIEVCDYGESGKLTGTYIVTTDTLNVRKTPNSYADRVGYLYRSELVTVTGFENGFAKIETADGLSGYASRYYLELVTAPTAVFHTVRFLDDDGETLLAELSVKEGSLPTPPAVPDVIRDEVRYVHVGWSEELQPITSDVSFVAVYAVAEAPDVGGADTEAPQDTALADQDEYEARGCGASVAAPLTLLSATLVPPVVIVLRKRKQRESL